MRSTPPTSAIDREWLLDADNPKTWSLASRVYHTAIPAVYLFVAAFGTSIYSAGMFQVAEQFHVSSTIAILGLSMYSFGLALGPLIGGPLSEAYGRKVVYLYSCPIFMLATVGSALSPNAASLSILRFIAGAAGAPCFAVSAGTAADIWDMEHGGGLAVVAITQAGFLGPTIGPLVGGYIMKNRGDWRWTMWVLLITIAPILVSVLFSRETSRKQILARRSKLAGNTAKAPLSWNKAKALVTVVLFRPLRMLFTEPIVASITVYNAFVFGELFAFFASYPYVFTRVYGFSSAEVGLAFIGVLVGTVFGVLTFMVVDKTLYAKAKRLAVDGKPAPEERLYTSMMGSFGISASLFWFGWTARSDVHWMVPIAAGLPFGWGMVCVFFGSMTYLVDTYHSYYGASALAANTLLRYGVGAGFPLFIIQMYSRLGIPWASSLLGFISILMLPIPWVLYKWGPFLRSKSAFQPA